MLKICFTTEDFYPNFIGGQGIFGYHLVLGLAKSGSKITVIAENKPGRAKFWQKTRNVWLLLVPFCFGQQIILAFLEYLYFILRCSNQYFDILHANQLSGLFFVLFKPKNIHKVVISVHNTNYDLFQKTQSPLKRLLYQPLIFLERMMYKRADALLFHANSEKRAVCRYYSIKEKPFGVVYLGASLTKVNEKARLAAKKQVRSILKIKENQKIVLTIARLVKRKKIETLVKALNILKLSGEKVTGIIIGQGPARGNLVKLVRKLHLNVSFVGFVPDIKTKPYFLAADLFVLPSVAEGGVSLSALEAASFGLPLILSPEAAGMPILRKGINGYIVDPNNPTELAEKIKLILPNAYLMGKESQKLAKQFSWERCTRETLRFYQSLLEKD
jgi:glycosyltransferase involved in cell wall biosynthesis